MKKYFFIVAAVIGLAACADNSSSDTGTGGSIDSASSAPLENPSDNTASPETLDSSANHNDSASSGSSTDAPNTNTPATDDKQSR